MDRARLQRIGKEAVDLAHDMVLYDARKILTALASEALDRDIVRHIVASALIAVGTSYLRRDGTPEADVVSIVRGIYESKEEEEPSNG